MENFRLVILIIGSLSILFGYFRFITDEKGHVKLNNYRFTGGILIVFRGMIDGTQDLFALNLTAKSISAASIYLGILLFYMGFSL